MNKYIGIAVAAVLALMPVGSALADDGAEAGANVQAQGQMGMFQGPSHGEIDEDASGTVDVEMHGGPMGSTTPWMRGEKEGLRMRFGTTTPPGHMGTSTMMRGDDHRPPHATSTDEDSSSSPKHGDDNRQGLKLPSFLQWLFGLPATTTVGDIRAQIQASTTVDVNASGTPAEGHEGGNGGFFAHFFSFFGFGSR